MKKTALLLAIGVLTVLPGCTAWQDWTMSVRGKYWSWYAWFIQKPHVRVKANAPHPIEKHYGEGWRAGYRAVTAGGSSESVPLFPPQKYWGVQYQNFLGSDEIRAWFAGWKDGARAAEADGTGIWVPLPCSGAHKLAVEKAKAEAQPQREEVPPGEPLPPAEPIEELPAAPVQTTQRGPSSN